MQDDKIRRQNDWDKWMIPRESNADIASSSASVTSNPDVEDLTAHLGGLGLHESASSSGTVDQNHHEVLQNGAPSGDDQGPVVEDNSGHQ
jgi:la-related protein 1